MSKVAKINENELEWQELTNEIKHLFHDESKQILFLITKNGTKAML